MSDDATRTGSSRPPDDSWRTRFERAGLNASLASQWESRIARLDAQGALVSNVDAAWDAFLEAPDPSLAIHTWLDWLDRIEDDGSVAEAGERWADPAFRSGFIVLAGTSEALGGYLLRWWRDFDPSAWREAGWVTARELASRLEKLIPIRDENEFLDRLRIFRKIEYLRIAWLDCVQRLPVDRVTRQISMLADELVRAAYERALLDTARRFGVEPPRRGFAILALGKLGGFELNYSSDIDLNFLWDASIDEIPRTSGGAIRGRFEVEAFFSRLAERLVSYISRFTSEGQLYRLDTRLRPEGNTARLVWSSRASLDYYYSVGRNWERQALIRLRHVAGDRELSQSFREELEPFIFPATLSIEGIQEMRRLKLQVEKIAADRSDERTEIKIGEGGIRDVEYIVQYLQLVHGAERKRLRVANVFEVLERLEAEGILTSLQTDVLRRGYRFLRRVEHHLQLDQMLQTHRLPDDPVAFRRLARGVGCPSEQAFRIELAKHATSIRRVYRLLFEQATTEHRIEDELPALLELPAESVSADDTAILAPLGFQDTKKAFDRLQSLARRSRIGGAGATMQAFQKLLFKLLRALSAQPQPDVALANFD
ncbi:MAG TPA: hypothetical protein VK116_10970, partial [Planctomycetota bacterium]|nr:hypothetical protein [Planctomycetota bacterium]